MRTHGSMHTTFSTPHTPHHILHTDWLHWSCDLTLSVTNQIQALTTTCKHIKMDSIASFHYATGGHYITMLPADWSISTSHDPFALQFLRGKTLCNPTTCIALSVKSVRYIYIIILCCKTVSKKHLPSL